MRKELILAIAAITGLISGCASVSGSPNQSISLQTREQNGSEVTGATCELTNNKGKWFVTTPGSVMVHRSNDDMQILCNKAGFEPGRAAVVSETKGSMFGNILLGGGIGAIVDHKTGSAYEYPAVVQILMGVFSKIETPKSSANQSALGPTGVTPTTQLTNSLSPDEKLKELKRLHDNGLISGDIYMEEQRKLLDSNR